MAQWGVGLNMVRSLLRWGWLFFGVFFAHVACAAGSRDVRIGAPDAWVHPLTVPLAAKTPEGSVGRHYLLFDCQRDVAKNATYTHFAFRLLTADGVRDGSQISEEFDPSYETLTFHIARLIRNGQEIDRLDARKIQVLQRETDMEELMYNGELSALLIFDDVRVGDIIEFAYTREGANPVFEGKYVDSFALDWGVPIEHLRYRVLVPHNRPVRDRELGPTKITSTRQETDGDIEIAWEAHQVPATTYDSDIAEWYDPVPRVLLTEFPSWAAVVNWALPLYAPTNSTTGPLHDKIESIKTAAESDAARALLAVDFVQRQIRYLGIEQGVNSHRPSAPDEVLRRGFGDCKDKARLLTCLLQGLGLDAHPVLVHSSRKSTLSQWLPTPYAFNHVVVALRLDGHDYVIDATLSHQRGPVSLRSTHRYAVGLEISPGVADLTHWSEIENDVAHTQVEENFTIAEFGGPAAFHVRSTYTNRAAERIRASLATANRDELNKSYLDFYARYYPEVSSTRPVTWHDDDDTNTVVVEEDYKVPALFTKTDGDAVWRAEFYPSEIDGFVRSPGAGGRTTPLAIDYPVEYTVHTVARLPKVWSVTRRHFEVKDTAFEFQRDSSGTGNEVEWNYRWKSIADHVDAASFGEHARNLKKAKDELGAQLTYNTAATKGSTFTFNWAMAGLAGLVLAACGVGAYLALRRRPQTVPPPLPIVSDLMTGETYEGLGGWLILVAIGVVGRPILTLVTAIRSMPAYLNLTTWHALTTHDTSTYKASYATVLPIEMTFLLVILSASLVVVALFFGRRALFPKVMIGLLLVAAASCGFQIWAAQALEHADSQRVTEFVQAIIICLVWIPYFLVSKRVKNTFTR